MNKYLTGLLLAAGVSGAEAAILDFTIPTSGFVVQSFTEVTGTTTGVTIGSGITSEAGFEEIVLDVDGANLDIKIGDIADGNPYFDADSGGPGGLGSCRILTASAQCAPSSDDNLTIAENESLRFDFANDAGFVTNVVFGDFLFHDNNHQKVNGSIQVTAASGSSIINVVAGLANLSLLGASNFLIFNDKSITLEGSNPNYYISQATISEVPLPAAAWLFGSALFGLAALKRARK